MRVEHENMTTITIQYTYNDVFTNEVTVIQAVPLINCTDLTHYYQNNSKLDPSFAVEIVLTFVYKIIIQIYAKINISFLTKTQILLYDKISLEINRVFMPLITLSTLD